MTQEHAFWWILGLLAVSLANYFWLYGLYKAAKRNYDALYAVMELDSTVVLQTYTIGTALREEREASDEFQRATRTAATQQSATIDTVQVGLRLQTANSTLRREEHRLRQLIEARTRRMYGSSL